MQNNLQDHQNEHHEGGWDRWESDRGANGSSNTYASWVGGEVWKKNNDGGDGGGEGADHDGGRDGWQSGSGADG